MPFARTDSEHTLCPAPDYPAPPPGDVGERTPLHPANKRSQYDLYDEDVRPLPARSFGALCAIRLVDPIAFTVIFPFVNEMIARLHLTDDPRKVGCYSGLIESIFAAAQLVSIYHWGLLSDKWGRRPVVFIGTLGLGLATVLFGLSRTLAGLLLSRALAGFFSGNVAVICSVLGELTSRATEATAFPLFSLFWPLGAILGPLLGGSLAGRSVPGWSHFPYLLPCLVAGLFACATVAVAWFWLEETHPLKRKAEISVSKDELVRSYGTASPALVPSTKSLLADPVMRALCLSGGALSFSGTAFDVVFVLFAYSPRTSYGLGFDAQRIGYALALAGCGSAVMQLAVMPPLLRRVDVWTIYRACLAVWPAVFGAMPGLHVLAARGTEGWVLWAGVGAVILLSRIAWLAYSVNMILIKQYAPPVALGRANGLAQLAQCLARAAAPAFVSSLFALSLACATPMLWVGCMAALSVGGWALVRAPAPKDYEHDDGVRRRWRMERTASEDTLCAP